MFKPMSLSLALALPLSLSLAACATDDEPTGEPISSQESAMTQQAVEGTVVAMAPITSTSPALIAASFRQSFGLGGFGCATVASDDLTFVSVTFSCTGLLSTTGTLRVERVSPTTLEATAELTVGNVSLDGQVTVTIPVTPGAERTLDAELTIAGPRRSLAAEASASWTANGACVTYSASGSVAAEGPQRSAAATFEVDGRTVCH
ncbi:MAG TPA: hypothetical protein VNO30_05230 [Kofleriaceae bacterium]|nr:hypothetical protein [Kofleriaceae bacterium]